MRLVISLPTRGRAQRLIANVKRSVANLALDNTLIMVQADADDKETVDVVETIQAIDKRVTVSVKQREDTIAAKWNRALAEPADVYLIDADDAPFATPGYDGRILDAARRFPDGIGMVYGHMANLSFSGVLAPTAKFCEKIGYIFPEYFPYWFVDHWLDDVCRHIDRVSFADVRTDQSKVGVTQEMREPGFWATWYDAAYLVRLATARKIIADPQFQIDEGLRQAKLSQPPEVAGARIDNWSRFVNGEGCTCPHCHYGFSLGVRGMGSYPPNIDLSDARYCRVKKRAVEMIPGLLAGMPPHQAQMFARLLAPPQTTIPGLKRAFA